MTQRTTLARPAAAPRRLVGVALLAALPLVTGCGPEPDDDDEPTAATELRSVTTTFPSYSLSTDPTSGRRLNTNQIGAIEFSNLDLGPGGAHPQSLQLIAVETGDFTPHMPWEQDDIWPGVPVDLTTLALDAHMLTGENIAAQQLRHADFHGSRWTVRVEAEAIADWQSNNRGVAYTLVEGDGEPYGLVELLLTVGWSDLPPGVAGPDGGGDEDSQELDYAAAGAVPLYTFWYEKDGRNGDDDIGLFETCAVPEGAYHSTSAVLYQDLFVHEHNGAVKPASDSLYIGCVVGAVGKVATWGYWPDELAELARFEAAVRMARADYCGDGWSYTTEGTPIGIADRFGVNDPSPELGAAASESFEAVWRNDGADCVNYIRNPAWTSLHCGRPSCEQLEAAGSYAYFAAHDDSLLSWR